MRVSHQLVLLLLRGRNSSSFLNKSVTNSFKSPSSKYLRLLKPAGSCQLKRMSSSTTNEEHAELQNEQLIFGKFEISSKQIFYTSPTNLSTAIVNLRPIVPGHVLVIPKRIVPKISQLSVDEYIDLWDSVRIVQNMLEEYYNAKGFNIAIQDGKAAGQSVPHVHVHILPRIANDFERNDDVYDELEKWAPTDDIALQKKMEKKENGNQLEVPPDEERRDRTMEEMENESAMYRKLLNSSTKQ